jgi:hypothetical protein
VLSSDVAPASPAPEGRGTSRLDGDGGGADTAAVEVSVLMPCLDEAATLATCIRKARAALDRAGLTGEIVVADNGSTDGSQAIARALGAVVVAVTTRGYGAALAGGIEACRGNYIVMADADDSYDFGHVAEFIAPLRAGADLVMGNRFRGGVAPGAMPPLHRYLGNPVLTRIGRLFFRSPCGDFHCGMRAFRRDAIRALGLRTTGMEFASEMLVRATLLRLRIVEVPTTLSRDGRGRPPHLRSWRDGWRHLRFLLLYSPRFLYLVPGATLIVAGLLVCVWLLPGPRRVGDVTFDVHTLLFGAVAVLLGVQVVLFGVFAKFFAVFSGLLPRDERLERLGERITLEVGLVVSGLMVAVGLMLAVLAVAEWSSVGFGALTTAETMRLTIPAGMLLVLGVQGVFASFLLSMFAIGRR